MAASAIEGIQSQGVGASLKHFALNSQETNRTNNDARVSEQTMRQLYLRPFEIAVREAKPWTVMTSYNRINGTMASENQWLLRQVLFGEWGYRGCVMTDWYGGQDAAAQMRAGWCPANARQEATAGSHTRGHS